MQLPSSVAEFEGILPKGDRKTFQIRSNPKMFEILSDGIYSDKVMAVIRELCCNAHDSTVTAGHGRPFTVNVPTSLDSNFWVEDTGLGIDPDKIVDIFWTYGSSTKTQDNTTIGALGLGSKSPFAYTKSSFLVINRFNGVEYKYFCFINEDGIPDGKLMFQSPTDEPNGVRVELAVRTNDVHIFRDRIVRFFSFWDSEKLPKFVGDSTVAGAIQKIRAGRKTRGKSWELRSAFEDIQKGAYAVMGGVPYPINLNALRNPSAALTEVCKSYVNITFPMGSLEFQVSREELSYTEATLKALEKGAAEVVNDMLSIAVKRLTGLATPFELAKAYNEVHDEQKVNFKIIADKLSQMTFKLTDGREYIGYTLSDKTVNVESAVRAKFNMQLVQSCYRTYDKGTQRFSIEPVLKVTLTSPEKLNPDGTVEVKSYANQISWFPSSVKPLPWVNQNRKRTAANYLHAGFTVTGTEFLRAAATLDVMFIINDMEADGSEGMRFYDNAHNAPNHFSDALKNNSLFFINGFEEGKSVAEAEAEVKAFFKDTLYEGVPIIYLSKLPGFKLPKPDVKKVAKPRAPMQRGTIELRMISFKTVGVKSKMISKAYDSTEIKFNAISDFPNTGYARHELAKPLLYVETNWGAPATTFEKSCVGIDIMSALNALGLLERFKVQVNGQETVRVALLSKVYIEDLKRRNVELVSFNTLAPQIAALVEADTDLVTALQGRFDDGGDWSETLRIKRITSNNFSKNIAPKIAPDHVLTKICKLQANIESLLKGNEKRGAALYMVQAWYSMLNTTASKLAGTVKSKKIVETYPMLASLNNVEDPNLQEHIAVYINAIDSQITAKREAERLERLAQLHAEAMFELS